MAFKVVVSNKADTYQMEVDDTKALNGLVIGDEFDGDIFGVGLHQFTQATQTLAKTRGNYVVLDGNGKYVAQTAQPTMSNYGFVA